MPPRLLALACAIAFTVISARHLDSVPQVYEDEPWQASTAAKLMAHGVFGSDLFAGFHAMDSRYYGFLPLHPLLEAVIFRVFGTGLWQARLETVSLGLLILVLTFLLAQRLFGAWVGALAVLILVFVRWTGLTYVQLTGIPLVDLSRIARYDPLAAALGLSALLAYVLLRHAPRRWALVALGILTALSGLAHLYGVFWIPALVLLMLWDRLPPARLAWFLGGVLLAWLPYAAYVLADVPDWRAQTAIYANRFELLAPGWYLDNLLQEYHRYGPGLGPLGPAIALRVGFWSLLLGLPLSLVALARRAVRAADAAARAIVVPALLLPALFALLIRLKLVNYTLLELPIEAVAVAWGMCAAWRWAAPRRRLWARAGIGLVTIAVCSEGAVQMAKLEAAAAATTPLAVFSERVAAYVPPDAHILGLHTYWFGFQQFSYRSFLVPIALADEGVPLDQALDRMDADTLLFDSRLRAYFGPSGDASADDRQRLASWMRAHDAVLAGSVDDPTYGLMEIYRLRR